MVELPRTVSKTGGTDRIYLVLREMTTTPAKKKKKIETAFFFLAALPGGMVFTSREKRMNQHRRPNPPELQRPMFLTLNIYSKKIWLTTVALPRAQAVSECVGNCSIGASVASREWVDGKRLSSLGRERRKVRIVGVIQHSKPGGIFF
jgi:hypothetical protein